MGCYFCDGAGDAGAGAGAGRGATLTGSVAGTNPRSVSEEFGMADSDGLFIVGSFYLSMLMATNSVSAAAPAMKSRNER